MRSVTAEASVYTPALSRRRSKNWFVLIPAILLATIGGEFCYQRAYPDQSPSLPRHFSPPGDATLTMEELGTCGPQIYSLWETVVGPQNDRLQAERDERARLEAKLAAQEDAARQWRDYAAKAEARLKEISFSCYGVYPPPSH